MGTWFWLNVPLMALIFSAAVTIPLWMVIKRPDTGDDAAATRARIATLPLHTVSRHEAAQWREAA